MQSLPVRQCEVVQKTRCQNAHMVQMSGMIFDWDPAKKIASMAANVPCIQPGPIPWKHLRCLFCFVLLSATEVTGQEIPPGGQALIADGAFESASFYSQPGVALRSWNEADQAWRITISDAGQNVWDSELSMRNSMVAASGEVALVVFNMRAIESTREDGMSWCTFYAQYPENGYEKDAYAVVSAGTEWITFFIPIQFSRALALDKMQFVFGFGADPGVLEIAAFEVLYYGSDIPFAELPRTRITYDGMDPDSPWRAEAAARIEQYRRGDFTLRIVDASGNPIEGATVSASQRDHAFDFGTAISFWRLLEDSPDNLQYRAVLRELFNAGSNENALKAPPWQGDWGTSRFGRQVALDGLAWMRRNGLRARGHVMVWPGWDHLPASIKALQGTVGQDLIPDRVLAHVRDIASATSGWVREWDVVNEPVSNHDLMDLFGEEVMDNWFGAASEELQPGTILYLNDYGLLSAGGRNTSKISAIYNMLLGLIARGVPVGGLGLQGHFGGELTPPARLVEILDLFASLGLRLRVTEFDIDVTDRELQAQYLRDFFTVLYSHPAVVGIQMWGFWEGAHWRPDAALYDMDWTPRPAAEAYQQLVWEEWTTEASGVTDANGEFAFRGAFGEYAVTIQLGESVHTHTIYLTRDETLLHLPAFPGDSRNLKMRVHGNAIQLSWFSTAHAYQRIESSPDLSEWARAAEFLDPLEGPGSILLEEPFPEDGCRFFRLIKTHP